MHAHTRTFSIASHRHCINPTSDAAHPLHPAPCSRIPPSRAPCTHTRTRTHAPVHLGHQQADGQPLCGGRLDRPLRAHHHPLHRVHHQQHAVGQAQRGGQLIREVGVACRKRGGGGGGGRGGGVGGWVRHGKVRGGARCNGSAGRSVHHLQPTAAPPPRPPCSPFSSPPCPPCPPCRTTAALHCADLACP